MERMTRTPEPQPVGVAPIAPDEPFDEDAYEALIGAIDALIAEADAPEPEERA